MPVMPCPAAGALTIETANTYLDEAYVAANATDVSHGQYIMIAVSDTGSGMSKEVIERAFDPLFTTKPTRRRHRPLGLSMVYGFVKQSGGHIKIHSETGEGTAIKHLSAAADGREARSSHDAARTCGRTKGQLRACPDQILLVEDDEEVNRFSSEVLREEGYHVISTA